MQKIHKYHCVSFNGTSFLGTYYQITFCYSLAMLLLKPITCISFNQNIQKIVVYQRCFNIVWITYSFPESRVGHCPADRRADV